MTANPSKLGADTMDQAQFDEWLTELAEPFWLKDAMKQGEFLDVNGFARALLARQPAAIDKQDERGACDRYQVLNEAGEALLAANHGEAYEVIYRMMKDARAASTSANVAQPLSIMRKAFRVTETEGNPDPDKQRFHMRFTFRSMEELHAADDQWRAFVSGIACSSANVAQGAEQPVYAYVYEYDTAFGLHRQFEPGTYNGSNPKRTVKVYAAPPAQTALTDDARDAAAAKWATANTPIREALAFIDGFDAARALIAAQSASGDTK